ncbi:hypothetical protein [Burkholderia thailandensis]|uniref:hypothetical protein n=1 Tax=Burkholderia thailandensis TaxID=57975 RepID=UPI0004B74208|nr:hypothetical protein [Burkholderia thailandensis]MCS3396845.1 hypothetical protein [Burkholderia thailandensis]MCS6495128.1 hypothetical protein [Burkholderia thailandensis]
MTHKMHMHDFASVGGGVSARRIGAAKRRVDGRIDAAASIQREVAHADFGEGVFSGRVAAPSALARAAPAVRNRGLVSENRNETG